MRNIIRMASSALHSWINIVTIILIWSVCSLHSQDTLSKSSCQFQDGAAIYNVELYKGVVEQPCPTETLSNQFKETEQRTLELSYQINQLQSTMIRVLEANHNLSMKVDELKEELVITKSALRIHQAAASECPPLYHVKSEEFKSCYMFVGRDKTWYDAELFCMSTGGHLIGLETEDEQQFIINYIRSSNLLPGKHMWTGGNDISEEDNWVWAGINVPFNFTDWLLYPHKDEGPVQMPDNHENLEHCMHLFHLHNYQWNDIWCGYKYFFICEYKLI